MSRDPIDHYVLVLPDREAAEALAEKLAAVYPQLPQPELHREALAGEDDADDAQWLVVLDPPLPHTLSAVDLETLATEYDGWLEDY
jgi:hypothetical protein